MAAVKQPGVQSAALSCDHHMNMKIRAGDRKTSGIFVLMC